MEKLKEWAKSRHLFNEQSVILGIAHDNPELVEPKNCRYDTCLVISNDYWINDDYICEGSILGGKYAVFKIRHTAEAVQEAWLAIFPELYKYSYQLDETRPILERYRNELVKDHYCEICVPIH
jgi:DNA gyrase inhibitor GyrI